LLFVQFLVGGALCGVLAIATNASTLLILRTLVALCLGGALTLAYTLGGMIVPGETRGAAFGWLAMGVQIGTAASPLLSGALAAVSLGNAYLLDAGLAAIATLVLAFGAPDLLRRREPRHRHGGRTGICGLRATLRGGEPTRSRDSIVCRRRTAPPS